LNSLGYDVSIMVRSILLRGFDQDMAQRIDDHMTKHGVNFIRDSVPDNLTKTKDGKILVTSTNSKTNQTTQAEYDTVLFAIGRYAVTGGVGLDKIGVKLAKDGKVHVNDFEQSNIENIYSIGDCAVGRPELTPPAIMVKNCLKLNI
jgi:thioredoxin reductase (NADPH)